MHHHLFLVGAAIIIIIFTVVSVSVSAADCPNNHWLAANKSCMACDFDAYPSDGGVGCTKYAHLNDKVLADFGAALDSGNTAWLLTGAAMVMLMTPALALFYSAMASEGSVVSTMMLSLVTMALISVLWLLFGYSLAFAPSDSNFMGTLAWGGWKGVSAKTPSACYGNDVPHMAFAIFQTQFAAITPCLISGAVVGRVKMGAFLLFSAIWMVVVYCPIVYAAWALKLDAAGETVAAGWLGELGFLDAAGGAPIHTAAGFSSIAASLIVGPRLMRHAATKPNPGNLLTGTALLCAGWFFFNSASALAADKLAANAVANTHMSLCTAIVVWLVCEQLHAHKTTLVGACTAAVIGLVAITPAAFAVNPASAIGVGGIASLLCYWINVLKINYLAQFVDLDDTLDVFLAHGCGGFLGLLLTGIFADDDNAGGATGLMNSGGSDGWRVVGVQLAGACFAASWSTVMSAIILLALKYTIGIRISEEEEILGVDNAHSAGARDFSLAPKDSEKPFACLFSDIEKSTLLFSKNSGLMSRLLDLHNHIMATICERHHVYVVKTIGDAFFCVSSDLVALTRCAIEMQEALFDAEWDAPQLNGWYCKWIKKMSHGAEMEDLLTTEGGGGSEPHGGGGTNSVVSGTHNVSVGSPAVWSGLRVRIGVHYGIGQCQFDSLIRSYDYTGLCVSATARVSDVAHGGQTLISESAWATAVQIDPTLTDNVDIKNLGEVPLRGVRGLTSVVQVLPSKLAGRRFPPLRLQHQQQQQQHDRRTGKFTAGHPSLSRSSYSDTAAVPSGSLSARSTESGIVSGRIYSFGHSGDEDDRASFNGSNEPDEDLSFSDKAAATPFSTAANVDETGSVGRSSLEEEEAS